LHALPDRAVCHPTLAEVNQLRQARIYLGRRKHRVNFVQVLSNYTLPGWVGRVVQRAAVFPVGIVVDARALLGTVPVKPMESAELCPALFVLAQRHDYLPNRFVLSMKCRLQTSHTICRLPFG